MAAAAMACLSTACLAPRISSSAFCSSSTTTNSHRNVTSTLLKKRLPVSIVLKAATSAGVEPDLEEDYRDLDETAGMELEENETFPWGTGDGAHSWHEGDDGDWWENLKEVFETSGGPVGIQGTISWLFLPGLVAGVYFDIDQDYLFLYTILFIFAFIGMEMAKPSKPSHFEPDMYKLKD